MIRGSDVVAMGNGKGLGLVALLGLALLLFKDKVGAEAFIPTFEYPSITYPAITYKQYYQFATEEVGPEELVEQEHPIAGRTGAWRVIYVNGKPRIPTPSGGLIPLPTVHVGRVDVGAMLEPIGAEKPEEYFADVEYNGKVRRAVGARLKPL